MRLVCNGVALDLESGAALSLKKVNPLFAFDKMTCERTQAFDIPATPHNERVFNLSKLPAYRGDGMRRRFSCELQAGTVVKRGYLYVDSYNKSSYSAVFVTGELLGLQRIKDLGKLKDIIYNSDTVEYGGAVMTPTAGLPIAWANVDYMRGYGDVHPNLSVAEISRRVLEQNALTPIALPAAAAGLRIIPAAVNSLTDEGVRVEAEATPENYSPNPSTLNVVYSNDIYGDNEAFAVDDYIEYTAETTTDYSVSQSQPRYGRVIIARPRIDMIIQLPKTLPDNIYIVDTVAGGSAGFLGGYSFAVDSSGNITRYGEPLAGREVQINKDQTFAFVVETDRTVDASGEYFGWYFTRTMTVPGLVIRAAKKDAELHDIVRMQDNLPDITYVELLKAVAAVSGKMLNYTEADGITFDDLDVENWPTVNVTDIATEVGELRRVFGDYAQRNFVKFKASELPVVASVVTYTLDNDNVETEATLAELPFSEGGETYDRDGHGLLVVNNDEDQKQDVDILADSGTPSVLMHVRTRVNNGLKQLCDASTSITLTLRMTLSEYESITAKTALLFRGTRYVWTEGSWAKNKCTLKLSKIW